MDYLLPTARDVPRIDIEHLEAFPLDADANFRAVGEGAPIVGPATVGSSVAPLGARATDRHLPPARVLQLIGTIGAE